jgi:putative chitinase
MRLAAFLATTLHESGNFRRLVESLDYKPEALRATWPSRFSPELAQQLGRLEGEGRRVLRPANQRAIAERAYGGRLGNGPEGSGDGWAYRGRGLIQITGRDNYRAAAAALGRPLDGLAAWLETPAGAAESAAWWWAAHGCNELADAGRVEDWRRRVNGGLIGLEDVRARYGRAREVVRG